MQINFDPFPILRSDRLVLRRIVPGDVECVFRMRSDPKVMQFVPRPLVTKREEALSHIELIDSRINNSEGINWAITTTDDDTMMGIIGLFVIKKEHFRAELGYMILPEFQNKGYISDAIALAVDYGFSTLGLHSIEAIIDPGNTASEKVLQRNDFVKEAHLRENEFWDGRFLDTVIYSKLTS